MEVALLSVMSLYAVRIAASITPPVLPKMMDAPVSIPIKVIELGFFNSIEVEVFLLNPTDELTCGNGNICIHAKGFVIIERAAAFSSSRLVSAFLAVQGFTDTDTMLLGLMPFFSAKYVLIIAASIAIQERVEDKLGINSGK